MPAAERAAWLRLVLTPGLGPRTARRLLATFGLPDAVFAAGAAALVRVVPEPLAQVLSQAPAPEISSAIAATGHWLAASDEHALLTFADPQYPQLLLQTADPPPVLFAVGRIELLNRPSLAIVGSRNGTQQGLANAQAFAEAIARAGVTIVSGMALGIDAAAHRGALASEADASTIAVVGTGVDVVYPSSHRALARQIRASGVIVSEFALGTPAIAHNFPRRNRLIAGLARGVLVIEAALRSGSLITARLAAEGGRDVFAVPGSIHAPLAKGCHRLIREGAKLVESANDILEDFGIATQPRATAAVADEATLPHPLLLKALGDDPVDLDTLAQRSALAAGELTGALLELELAQHVVRLPGNRYQRLR